ncbi:hypothetical protein [Pseudomonas sp.]|uniref:hypothetical protein n=1 Tax=Pseudomonas sp. TaxID=306 RepID=UPI003BB4C8A6
MESKDRLEFRLEDLSLEALSLESMEQPADTPAQPAKTTAQFKIDTRGKSERRLNSDRRNAIRFEEDRRASEDRRAGPKPWALGTDI